MHEPKSAPSSSNATLVPLFPRSWRQIDRYELIAEIARGGMGTVYLCRQTGQAGFQRLCALKLMHEHLVENQDFVGMFLDEARIAASIHHHNVVSILDLGRCERGFFVVMEYIEGCTLGQLLRRSRTHRPPELVAPIVLGLLDGLHAAHTHRGEDGQLMQLVHRDVSPANVLIGVDGVARITDFGIAKARSRITSTRPGVFKGKLAYTAPELLDGRAPVDARADIFAAGAVLWRTLTGRNLFLGDTDAATLHNILHRELPRPSTVGLCPPSLFDDICLRALSRDVNERYQSAAEMARDVRQVCGKHGLLGAPADVADWIRSTFRDDLEARRHTIRTASERSRGSDEHSLPELPAMRGNGTESRSAWTPSSMLEIADAEPVNELDELEIEFVPVATPSRRRWRVPAAVLAIAAAAGLGLLFAAGGDSDTATARPQPVPQPPAAQPEPPAPAPATVRRESDEPSHAATRPAPAPPAPVEAAPSPAPTPEPQQASKRSRSTAHSRKPAPRPEAARPEPPAPAPSPEPVGEPELESNPYIRR